MSLLFKFRPLVINPQLAERIGLNEAIVLQQLKYWLNETESGVDHEGRRWVYNTVEQWQKQFPFWSQETVKRALSSLQKQGLVLVEKLAKAQHDHTNHYAINYQSDALFDQVNLTQSDQVNLTSSGGSDCPVLHTEITTKTTAETSLVNPLEGFDQFWKLYPKKKSLKDAKKAWAKLKPNPELRQTLIAALGKQRLQHDWVKDGGQYVPLASSWLNGEKWTDEVGPLAGATTSKPSAFNNLPNHTPDMYQGGGNGPAF
ncbi:hypothetical protein ATI14_1746 [Pseudomonas tolaasii NCPPB 2192]|uniref:Phage protein (TIGR02220 family) n=1 Tax=Pseudomonas tolaasii NCPPB 2192 TaxID=564423 RepID=A0ABX4QDL7_PSETO|nr:hypothetical protein [Pseudomonas tolaasii]ARB29724.1 hypothetical protein B5P22_21305 [Pseudomonas tolaasii]KAB0468480.1 hypothetical protein F7R12_22995 [Pseudomonas tolaasii]PKA74895.1 hypothetical protein ATI14_1746 [Pseudomonas tolaasii NCPPB 2192]